MGYIAGIGALEGGIATILSAGEQDKRRKQLMGVAETPGLDFSALTSSALGGYNYNLPGATALAGKLSLANQAQVNAQEEQALPGVGAARGAALGAINGLFADNSDWLKGVQRRGAALGIGSGLMGSGAGQLATLHLSDQEQQQRTALGTGLLGSLIGSMRFAQTPGVQSFLGPSIQDQVAQRAQERTQRMNILLGAYNQPTGNELIYRHMQQEGASLEGFGLGGGGFGGGGGAPAASSANYSGPAMSGALGGGWGTGFA